MMTPDSTNLSSVKKSVMSVLLLGLKEAKWQKSELASMPSVPSVSSIGSTLILKEAKCVCCAESTSTQRQSHAT